MRRKRSLLFPLISILLCFSAFSYAQNWSGILALSRAADWSGAGVEGGIPNRTTNCTTSQCNTLFNGTVTIASIDAALASAPAGSVVRIPAGTFTLNGGVDFNQSNVTLRGAGADSTKLIFTGTTSGCHLFYNAVLLLCGGSGNIGVDSPSHTANWTAGWAQGTSVITLDSTTGLSVGSTLFLDQLDDASDGWPATGDIYVCQSSGTCSSEGGGGGFARSSRGNTMLTKVTAINGNNITINPPVTFPNFRSTQNPGAWWGDPQYVAQNSGIENLSIDFTGGGQAGLELVNCTNCWVKGVRMIFTGGPGNFVFHMLIVNGFHVTVRDSYFYGPDVQGNTQYAITPHTSGSLLIENNILHHNVSPIVPNGPFSNSVIAYNFITGSFYTGPGPILHNAGEMMNLWEGNNTSGFLGDIIHGSHFMGTLFRNHFDGHQNNPPGNVNSAVLIESHNRFFNVIGNVMGDSYFNTYETDYARGDTSIYDLGWDGGGAAGPPEDSNVPRTTMRWGNYDTVTGAVRWCGNSSNPGWTTICASKSEVPSGITNFSNPVPGNQTLPASFYLNAKPAWFGSAPWPPVGPDVTGGNVSGFAGHANMIPARVCYNNSLIDSVYGGSNVRLFSAANCYPGGSAPAPPPPIGLTAAVQ